MIITRLKTTLITDTSILKLAMVSLALMMKVTVPPLPLGGRDAYFYTSKITHLLVHSSREQGKHKLSLVACKYIACRASQTLILAGYIYVLHEYLIHHVTSNVLPRDAEIPDQRTSTVCIRKRLLCKKLEFICSAKTLNFNTLQYLFVHMQRSRPSVFPPVHFCMR